MKYDFPYPGSDQLVAAAEAIGTLVNDVLFIGGATIGLYLTDPASREPRPTRGVDISIQVTSLLEYYQFEQLLRERGFVNDVSGGPICRFLKGEIVLDVVPTDPVLGFNNRWHKLGFQELAAINLGDVEIRIPLPGIALAMKLEAYADRGATDALSSHDLEDIITVIDNRPSIIDDAGQATDKVRQFLNTAISELVARSDIREVISAHVMSDTASQDRVDLISDTLAAIIEVTRPDDQTDAPR